MTNSKHFAQSLSQMITEVESTIPHAKENGYPAISADMSLEVAKELLETINSYQSLEAYLTQRIAELEADKNGQTIEIKAVLNGGLVELTNLKKKLKQGSEIQ